MSRRRKRKQSSLKPAQQKRWVLVIDSKEAATNLYSILLAFQQPGGGGLIDRQSAKHITEWLTAISDQVPSVRDLAQDSRGPFRERDLSPIDATLELDPGGRNLMLALCEIVYSQLTTREGRRNWIENQGQADYELAVKNFRAWLNSLEGDGVSVDQ